MMQVNNNNSIAQNRMFSSTGKIAGVQLPNFDDDYVYTKKTSGISDSEYNKAIVEQAIKDQSEGKFQNDSSGFNKLAKSYISEVSPDRKKIITEGLKKISKDNAAVIKPLDMIALLFDGEVKYQKDSNTITYAEFEDSNGETIAKYSNGSWTMFNTKEETARQIEMCSIYNKAWNAAAKANNGSNDVSNSSNASIGNSENNFDMLA